MKRTKKLKKFWFSVSDYEKYPVTIYDHKSGITTALSKKEWRALVGLVVEVTEKND